MGEIKGIIRFLIPTLVPCTIAELIPSSRAVNYGWLTLLGLLAGFSAGLAQESSPALNVPKDFEARVVADALPPGTTAFDFDASGRLWVAAPYVTTRFFRTTRLNKVLVYEI